jgi:hypothetical protein
MNLVLRVEAAKQMWRLLLPTCPAPDDSQLARWGARFNDAELQYAFVRASSKWRRGPQTGATSLHRYCTGILLGERVLVEGEKLKNAASMQ